MQTRIYTGPVSGLTGRGHAKGVIEELHMASVCLFLIFLLERIRKFEKSLQSPALADDQITQMRRQCSNEMQRIETFCQYLVKSQKR